MNSQNDTYLQLLISGYTVESFFWVFQRNGLLQETITPQNIPSKFPLKLNTSDPIWYLVAPKMQSTYPNDAVHIVFKIQSGTNVTSSEDDDSFTVSMPIAMDVQAITSDGPKDAFILGCPLKTTLKLSVKDRLNKTSGQTQQVIAGHMEYLDCDLGLENTTVGKVHYKELAKGIDFAIEHILLPLLNDALRVGFPIPSGSFIHLTNSTVSFGDNFAAVGSQVKVNLTKILPDAEASVDARSILGPVELDRIETEFRKKYDAPRPGKN